MSWSYKRVRRGRKGRGERMGEGKGGWSFLFRPRARFADFSGLTHTRLFYPHRLKPSSCPCYRTESGGQ